MKGDVTVKKVDIFIWYGLVLLTIMFLVGSFYFKNLMLAACAFFLAMKLSVNASEVPLPKVYQNLMFHSTIKNRK